MTHALLLDFAVDGSEGLFYTRVFQFQHHILGAAADTRAAECLVLFLGFPGLQIARLVWIHRQVCLVSHTNVPMYQMYMQRKVCIDQSCFTARREC